MPALAIFTHAVLKTEPKIWLKKKKIAGRLYEIPIFISSRRSKAIAIRWLLEYAKK
jgi:ribosomal protein S7